MTPHDALSKVRMRLARRASCSFSASEVAWLLACYRRVLRDGSRLGGHPAAAGVGRKIQTMERQIAERTERRKAEHDEVQNVEV